MNTDIPAPGNPGEYHYCRSLSSFPLYSLIGLDEKTSKARGKDPPNNTAPPPLSTDLAGEIRGMYRLLDLISESGSNGCGNGHFQDALPMG